MPGIFGDGQRGGIFGAKVDPRARQRIEEAFAASQGMQEPSQALYAAKHQRAMDVLGNRPPEGPGFWDAASAVASLGPRAVGGAQKMWQAAPMAAEALWNDPLGSINRAGLAGQAATDAIVQGAVRPFTQFGDPNVDPVENAADIALTAMGGSAAIPKPAGSIGTFGGIAAKTADLGALRRAEELKAAGASRDAIWQETGWDLEHPDKLPRFEISDADASFNEPIALGGSDEVVPLGERLQHARAYDAYPDLKDIRSNIEMWEGGGGGMYGLDDTGKEALVASGRDPLSLKKTALHELQHAIQAREGFARGGNPAALVEDALEARKRWEDVEKPQAEKTLAAEEDLYSEWLDNERINQGMPHGKAQVDAFRARYAQQFPENAARRNAAMDVLTKGPPKSRDIYERLAGETEARNVSTRSQWADKFRRADPPWTTQDVPDEQQIVRFRTGDR